jgi:hypothetical protein
MAKRRKKPKSQECNSRNCLEHKFWPSVSPAFGPDATYHLDPTDGEITIRTGLRVLPDGEVVECPWEYKWVKHKCPTCNKKGSVRMDSLDQGLIVYCPYCSATQHIARLN